MTVVAAVEVLSQRGANAAATAHLAARRTEPCVFERNAKHRRERKAAAAVTFEKQSRHGNVRPPRHAPNFINTTPADVNTPELIGIHHPAGRS